MSMPHSLNISHKNEEMDVPLGSQPKKELTSASFFIMNQMTKFTMKNTKNELLSAIKAESNVVEERNFLAWAFFVVLSWGLLF